MTGDIATVDSLLAPAAHREPVTRLELRDFIALHRAMCRLERAYRYWPFERNSARSRTSEDAKAAAIGLFDLLWLYPPLNDHVGGANK